MQKILITILSTILLSSCLSSKTKLSITSPNFNNYSKIPEEFSCTWDDIHPELHFTNIPKNTKSLALIMDDQEAPWWEWIHWMIWNILPTTENIEKDNNPMQSTTWLNSFWEYKYWWPCPPSWTHKYSFTLYALDTVLNIAESSSKKEILYAMSWSIIENAILVGKFSKD